MQRRTVLVADGMWRSGRSSRRALRSERPADHRGQWGAEVQDALIAGRIDFMVLGHELADMSAVMLLRGLVEDGAAAGIAFIVYGEDELNPADHASLKRLAELSWSRM